MSEVQRGGRFRHFAASLSEASREYRLLDQAPAMYELLKDNEWAGSGFADNRPRCKYCNATKYPNYPVDMEIGEHRPHCRLAAVLKAVEGNGQEETKA